MCNFVEVVRTHEDLLQQIEDCNDRVGKLFLNSAPLMKKVHQAYCAAHPKAIVILDKYKLVGQRIYPFIEYIFVNHVLFSLQG